VEAPVADKVLEYSVVEAKVIDDLVKLKAPADCGSMFTHYNPATGKVTYTISDPDNAKAELAKDAVKATADALVESK
jgi:hypothetical protein